MESEYGEPGQEDELTHRIERHSTRPRAKLLRGSLRGHLWGMNTVESNFVVQYWEEGHLPNVVDEGRCIRMSVLCF